MSGSNSNLRAIVDIGSNGIRFSISSIEPKQARILPCLFQDRAAISLFDAQHSIPSPSSPINATTDDGNTHSDVATPVVSPSHTSNQLASKAKTNDIPGAVTEEVCNALVRFKSICHDFGVPDSHVHVIATEATREASNSVEFRQALTKACGWEIQLLTKEDEARTGAYGVASSFYEVQGLFMDLGGGSTQLSWITCKDGEFEMSPQPVSLPYGAAALTRRLSRESRGDLFDEIAARLKQAVELIDIPHELEQTAQRTGGYKIYVSGGGFRGLGHLILSRHGIAPYPLPIINGFSCTQQKIFQLIENDILGVANISDISRKSFRISERRSAQLPAVALLVSAILHALPRIRKVLFCQGGVREGILFHDLPSSIKAEDPLIVATRPYAPLLAARYIQVLTGGIPQSAPMVINQRLVQALVNVAFVHSSYPKELQPNAALTIASTGLVSGTHGLSHEVRALLGLALCQRWGGELPDQTFRDSLISVVNPKRLAWWACYCGHLMHVVGGVYPGGNVRGEDIMKFSIYNVSESGDRFTLLLQANKRSVQTTAPMVRARINNLGKKLKKLTKEFGKEDSMKVSVTVEWV